MSSSYNVYKEAMKEERKRTQVANKAAKAAKRAEQKERARINAALKKAGWY